MKLKERLIGAGATCLIWTLCLSSCGGSGSGIRIKTWYADTENVRPDCHSEPVLVRKNSRGDIQEALNLLKMQGYRCYSPDDDRTWRTRLAMCCARPEP